MTAMKALGIVLATWLVIGLVAAGQRGYLNPRGTSCSHAADIAITAILGPLNYLGVRPETNCAELRDPVP